MTDRKLPTIIIEKISLDRVSDLYEAAIESSTEWFSAGILSKPDLSVDELERSTKNFIDEWENGTGYMFNILDASSDQVVGFAFLNNTNHAHQTANLGYSIRTSRMREGIATETVRLAARYGFEKLGLQRIEIVISKDNSPSNKVAQKSGAVREGLLRNRLRIQGLAHDAYMYSLLPEDFGIINTD